MDRRSGSCASQQWLELAYDLLDNFLPQVVYVRCQALRDSLLDAAADLANIGLCDNWTGSGRIIREKRTRRTG